MQERCQARWPPPATRSTRSRPTRARAGSARTTSTTGASATTSASAPARTASSRLGATQAILRRWKVKHPARLPGRGRHAGRRSAATNALDRAALPFDYMLNALRLRRGLRARATSRRAPACRARPSRAQLEQARATGLARRSSRRSRRADRAGPALHQRRDRAVPRRRLTPRVGARPAPSISTPGAADAAAQRNHVWRAPHCRVIKLSIRTARATDARFVRPARNPYASGHPGLREPAAPRAPRARAPPQLRLRRDGPPSRRRCSTRLEQQLFRLADHARNPGIQAEHMETLRTLRLNRADLVPRYLIGLEAALAGDPRSEARAASSAPPARSRPRSAT